MFVLQIKYKSFLNIYSFCKKKNFDHKKYICEDFLVNSIIWSLKFRKQPICDISEAISSQNLNELLGKNL